MRPKRCILISLDLDKWPKIIFRNLKLKKLLFGVNNIVKNSDTSKYVYIGYVIVFDGKDSWSFGNGFTRNVVTFDVDNSSSHHTDNCNNNFLVLDERETSGVYENFGAPDKKS